MKTLTLLRHAKSGWDDRVSRDVDRPLNPKGKRAAVLIGQHMRSQGMAFDHVVASPAVRVAETIDAVVSGYARTLAPVVDRRIYLASAATLLDVVREFPEGATSALMVGHNPGLEDLMLMLVPSGQNDLRDTAEQKYPTATIAEMTFAIDDWAAAAPGSATLTRFVRPRDLDPTLGPDSD